MAWQYTALQTKLTSIQAQLSTKMEQKSNCSDQLMQMDVTNNCIQADNNHVKTLSLKRKAEEYFLVDNSKSNHSCLMFDMYTQTDKNMNTEITMSQIYDVVRKNSERLHKMEEVMLKICNAIDAIPENVLLYRTHNQAATPQPAAKKPISTSLVLQGQPSPTNTRPSSFIATPAQSTYNYPGMSVTNNSFSSGDYVTQVNEMGDWDERNDLVTAVSTAPTVSMVPALSENRLVDVNSAASGKSVAKEEWGCENGPLGGEQPSGPGCWLGDVDDVNRRAWFSGDPKIIERCENYGVNPVKLALSLTEALFTREEMAASNVRGTRGKDTLDPSKIKAIRAHVDFKYPIEEDRMEVRWQLIKPKLDSKCRSQRRLQREHKWKFERTSEKQPNSATPPKVKRPALDVEEREMLLYGSPKTVLNPVTVYTENPAESASFSEGQEGYLPNPDD